MQGLALAVHHDVRTYLALGDVALRGIVPTWRVGEPYAHWRSMRAGVAPELGTVGDADAQQLVGIDASKRSLPATTMTSPYWAATIRPEILAPSGVRAMTGDSDTGSVCVDSC